MTKAFKDAAIYGGLLLVAGAIIGLVTGNYVGVNVALAYSVGLAGATHAYEKKIQAHESENTKDDGSEPSGKGGDTIDIHISPLS